SAVRNGGAGVSAVDLRRSEPHTHPDPKPAGGVPGDRKVAWLREAEDSARSVDPAVRQVLAVHADSRQRILVANSEGLWAEEIRPRLRLVAQVVAMRDGVFQTGFEGPGGLAGAELLDTHPPDRTGRRAAEMAVAMLDGRQAPAGDVPVRLGPGGGRVRFVGACGRRVAVG